MKVYNCIIVEDEELARDLLEKFIEKIPNLELIAKCENPLKARPILQNENIDLMFLDIQMPELTGIDFLKTLRKKPVVIFTTAYPSYALEGYQLDVTDYLLKPFPFERFMQAVEKGFEMIELKTAKTATQQPSDNKDYLLINAEHKVHKVKFTDIDYVESMREYAVYHTTSHGKIIALISLKKLESILPKDAFMRIHKSYIINTKKVSTLSGNMLHLANTQLPIGLSYKPQVLEALFQ